MATVSRQRTKREDRAYAPWILALGGATLWSTVPLTINRLGISGNPLQANIGIAFGSAVGAMIMLSVGRRLRWFGSMSLRRTIALYRSSVHTSAFRYHALIYIVSVSNVALFAWSQQYIDTATAAVINEMYPIIPVFYYSITSRHSNLFANRNDHVSARAWGLMSLVPIGLIFVIWGQLGTAPLGSTTGLRTIIGAAIALCASILAGGYAARVVLGEQMAERWLSDPCTPQKHKYETHLKDKIGLWYSMLTVAVAGTVTALVCMVISIGWNLDLSSLSLRYIGGGLVLGLCIDGLGGILVSAAHLKDDSPMISTVSFVTPPLSILLLSFFAGIHIARIDYFLVGTTLMMALIIMIQIDPDPART